ncbi:hypothetical protein [Rathayibacter sp. VKM Ac-2928]|uniref:hypothetical protein n=1 Tax=Rathayibacter sp. VKM Ac-2928 TaxID=2929479 RepID=UPI001FB38611|nr:hypothetical protein [Rathayibacter sp. VKM Ac-2928]MCJ1685371.1 hypothetical protein [Rathayibacter sp. VKM Ac-2928]
MTNEEHPAESPGGDVSVAVQDPDQVDEGDLAGGPAAQVEHEAASTASNPALKNGETKTWTAKRIWQVVTGASAALAAIAASLTPVDQFLKDHDLLMYAPPSVSEIAAEYDNTLPADDDCEVDAITLISWPIESVDGAQPLGMAELRKSPKCDTVWLRTITDADQLQISKVLERAAGNGLPEGSVNTVDLVGSQDSGSGTSFSDQLYLGHCVTARVMVTDADEVELGSVGPVQFCE